VIVADEDSDEMDGAASATDHFVELGTRRPYDSDDEDVLRYLPVSPISL
jgi:hypothetical protein